MRTLLRALALLALLGAPALAQQQPIGISGLPVATAPNPQTDYALGIIQQLNPAGVPFFVTSRVPISKLVGPAGTPAYLTGINVTTLPAGAQATGFLGGATPNYILNLGLPAGPAGTPSVSGGFTPGDFVLANSATGMTLVDGGAPGAAAFKPLAFFLQVANNLSDVPLPATARANLSAAKSGANSDITALSGLTTPLSAGQGGTGAPTLSGGLDAAFGATQGGLLYRSATGWTLLGPGASGQVLGTGGAGANPAWTNTSQGTVTSVGLALPSSLFTVSGSPVTASGTLTGALATQAANAMLAGPASGAGAIPTFRALVPADDPAPADGCIRVTMQSSTVLAVAPRGCSTLVIGGVGRTVAAHTCSIASPSTATLYYVYEAWSGSAVTCSFSTTGHITGADGREYLNASGSANTAQVLAGMVYTSSSISAPLQNSATCICVRSYFNSPGVIGAVGNSGIATASTSPVAAFGTLVTALTWADEIVKQSIDGYSSNNVAGQFNAWGFWIDGANAGPQIVGHEVTVNFDIPLSGSWFFSLTEGAHTLYGAIWNSGGGASSSFTMSNYVTVGKL